MQEAANDLVKTEEDEIGEEHEGELRKEEDIGEEGGPALMDEVGDKEEEEEEGAVVPPEEEVGEVAGVDCMGDML